MTTLLLHLAVTACVLGLAASLVRLLRGPTAADRIVALDAMGLQTIVLFVALALVQRRVDLLEPAVLVALVGFVATVALARLLPREPS